MRGLRITPRLLLPEALVHFMNLLPSHPSEISDTTPSSISSSEVKTIVESETANNISGANILSEQMFEFNEILYLKAKNEIDINSYSASVRHNLIQQLKNRIIQRLDRKNKYSKTENSDPKRQGLRKEMKSEEEEEIKSSVVTVVDLGAGLLNMLSYTQKLFWEALDTIQSPLELQYIAFESNKNLETDTINMLTNGMGFTEIATNVPLLSTTTVTLRSSVKSFKGVIFNDPSTSISTSTTRKSVVVTVHLISEDFMSDIAIKILKDLTSSHRCIDDDTSAVSTGIDVDDRGYCSRRSPIDLFIGCCVADLISPKALAVQVVEMAGDEGGLLYLPITFCGTTKIIRGEKVERSSGSNEMNDDDVRSPVEILTSSLEGEGILPLPSDEEVFDCYLKYLIDRGHHVGSERLQNTLEAYGCTIISDETKSLNTHISTNDEHISSSSNWKISKKSNSYMWKCMMRFIALGTASEFLGKYDLKSWFDGVEKSSIDSDDNIMIQANNIDILALLPEIVQAIKAPNHIIDEDSSLCTEFGTPSSDALKTIPSISRLVSHDRVSTLSTSPSSSPSSSHSSSHSSSYSTIPLLRRSVEFISPRNVHIIEEPVPTIGPKQLLVRTSCSLVSTGTELKVFKGDLDPDQPADLTIDDMDGKMAYPLRYGYSLVGTVVKVGDDLDENDWLGKSVFSFSPHASAVVIDSSSAIIVPKGIPPEDAVFLPSVETAVSFVQAANINLGEKVLVVGQGLIGVLTGAVISKMINADVTIADISEKRLEAASLFIENAKKWNPLTPLPLGCDFDLSIEVSGHPSGLQTAVDNTGTNGRIILGSWYGESPSQLKLGLKFHRSGLKLITSQVSTIPPELRGRWDKNRRFDVAWDVIKQIKPSSLISSTVPLISADVLAAYNKLERGEEVTVLFKDFLGSDK